MSPLDVTAELGAPGGRPPDSERLEPGHAAGTVRSPALPVAGTASQAASALPRPADTTPPARAVVLARARAALLQLLPELQYRISRLGVAGQTGLAALAAAAVVAAAALIPAQHALLRLNTDLVRAQHATVTAEVEQAAPRLLASLPTRMQMPGVIGEIVAQARSAGVTLDSGRYRYAPAKRGTIDSYELEFPVKATYPAIRTFINGTLTALPAAALDKLRLERKAVADPLVSADIGFVVFVRGE